MVLKKKRFNVRNRLVLFLLALVIVLLVGSIGYTLIKYYVEDQPVDVVDAIYWTVITLGTLGYYPPDVALHSTTGEAFTIAIVLTGIMTIFIALQIIVGPWLEASMKRVVETKRVPLPKAGHVIICGFSDLGKEVIGELAFNEVSYVIVDDDEELLKKLSLEGIPTVHGDPTEDATLKQAGIKTAIALVAVSDDTANAFISLTAKKLRQDMRVISSVQKEENRRIILKAGADKVVSPKSIAGTILGSRAVKEYDASILDEMPLFEDVDIHQYPLKGASALVGKSLKETEIQKRTGAVIVGVRNRGVLLFNPEPNTRLEEGMVLIAIGNTEQLESLRGYLWT